MVTAKEAIQAKDTARLRLAAAAERMDILEEDWKKARLLWERECLDTYDDGLTYDEIAAISQRSRIRISQVLASERERRGIEPKGKKVPKKNA